MKTYRGTAWERIPARGRFGIGQRCRRASPTGPIILLALFLHIALPITHAGLLAHWPLDEGSGTLTADATGNGHTGTLVNGPSWVGGVISNALHFTGDKRVDVSQVAGLSPTNAITLSLWIKPSAPGTWSPFFTKGNGHSDGWALIYTDQRKVVFKLTGQNGNSMETASALPTNRWTYLVATYDGASGRIYLDGLLDRTAPWSGQVVGNNDWVAIGVPPNSSNEIPGVLDDARIYDQALNEREIARLFLEQDRDLDRLVDANEVLLGTDPDNPDSDGDGWPDGLEVAAGTDPLDANSHPDLSSGLVGWWKLDETNGTTAADSSGCNSPGTLVNGPAWTTNTVNNGGVRFDGVNDYLSAGTGGSSSPLAVTNLTMSLWAYVTNRVQDVTVLDRRYNNQGYTAAWQSPYARVLPLFTGVPVVPIDLDDVTENAWHLFAFSYDGATVKSYLDGTLIASATYTNAIGVSTEPLYLAQSSVFGGRMEGTLDDARIYNRALSAGDVAALALLDTDGDGLPDAQETRLGTNPNNADSDGDGMPDGWEIAHGFNPLNSADGAADADGDGVSNLIEYLQGRDPTKGAVADTTGLVNLTVYTPLEP